jgi:hypothetical protein
MSNKDRIFVAISTRPDTSTISCTSSTLSTSAINPAKYTWSIYIEPKISSPPGSGTSITVDDDLSVPFLLYSFDSQQFHVREHTTGAPENQLGRIMIGKAPPGRTLKDIALSLRRVPLPSDPTTPICDTVSWTRAAVEELQDEGLAEKFDVEVFMGEALKLAVEWHRKAAREPVKVNYTWSRTFP